MSARGLTYLSKPENGEKKHAATAPKRNRMGSFFSPNKDSHRYTQTSTNFPLARRNRRSNYVILWVNVGKQLTVIH